MNCYKYTNLVSFLNALLAYKKEGNTLFSLRAWSKSLGYKHPSFLSQCLRGERTISAKLLQSILEKESFDKDAEMYIMLLFFRHLVKGETNLNFSELEKRVLGERLGSKEAQATL